MTVMNGRATTPTATKASRQQYWLLVAGRSRRGVGPHAPGLVE
jgi:hypothetical protein